MTRRLIGVPANSTVGLACKRCQAPIRRGEMIRAIGAKAPFHITCPEGTEVQGGGLQRDRVEVAEPPVKLWTIPSVHHDTPTATVGYGPIIDTHGARGIRLELNERLSLSLMRHKDRRVVATRMDPPRAIELGKALVEAGEQALAGQTPATKRSG